VAADPAAGPSDDLETAQAAARTARRLSAWIRRGQRYFMISLVFFLILYVIGVAVLNYAAQSYGLHRAMNWFIVVGLLGALLFLGLFEAARPQFHYRQILWGWWSFCRSGGSRSSRFSGWRWSAVGARTGRCSLSTWPPGWRS